MRCMICKYGWGSNRRERLMRPPSSFGGQYSVEMGWSRPGTLSTGALSTNQHDHHHRKQVVQCAGKDPY